MEEHKKLDYDSDVIICEDMPETISVSTSPETLKKPKSKKRKRKVKRGVNINNNTETLLITQKLKVKKTKLNCVININTVCERSDSIVRHHTNVCKKKAYYHRIVPVCMREVCSGVSSCCRLMSRNYNKYLNSKAGSLSPVSSIPLAEVFSCTNISYEDVTNGSFSSASEGDLDTLIIRTRQREKQIDNLHARRHTTSTPMSIGIASPFSIDDKKSIHSDNTMILNPLPIKTYSPSLDVFRIDLENVEETNDMNDINIPYSPTMTPDLIKMENIDYSPVDRVAHNDDNIPYSPTYTPETIEIGMDDLKRNIMDEPSYSPTFTPGITEMENVDNEPYSPTMTPDKMENTNNSVDRANATETNVGYSSRSTVTPDFHKFTITLDISNNIDIYSLIKQENLNESTININTIAPKFAILTPDLIKKENEMSHENREIDYNMSNAVDGKSAKDEHQREQEQANPNGIIVKPEKGDHTK